MSIKCNSFLCCYTNNISLISYHYKIQNMSSLCSCITLKHIIMSKNTVIYILKLISYVATAVAGWLANSLSV